jgi:ASC-1-like (ASCH) protein
MNHAVELVILIIVVCALAIIGAGYVIGRVGRAAYQGGADDCEWCGDDTGGAYDGAGTFRLSVRDPWYTSMLKGEKVVEARIDSPPFNTLKVGDPVIVVHSRPQGSTEQYTLGDYKYKTTITKITKYNDFAELVKTVGISALYPGKKTPVEAAAIFHEFATPEKLAGHGVLAIEFAKPSGNVRVPK